MMPMAASAPPAAVSTESIRRNWNTATAPRTTNILSNTNVFLTLNIHVLLLHVLGIFSLNFDLMSILFL